MPILQRVATSRNWCRRIVAPEGAGSSPSCAPCIAGFYGLTSEPRVSYTCILLAKELRLRTAHELWAPFATIAPVVF
jgi:hypothetical protein